MEKLDVYESIKNEIVNLEIEPGTPLKEVDAAKKYNISRTPVRDVFKRLSLDGLLDIKSHVGSFVTKIDIDRITDTLYVRLKVELAVLKDIMNTITSEQINILNKNLENQKDLAIEFENMEKTVENITDFAKVFLELDNSFHRLLFSFASKEGVWDYLFENEQHYKRFRIFLNSLSNLNLILLVNEHKAILDALLNKDEREIDYILSNHIYNGIKSIKENNKVLKYFN